MTAARSLCFQFTLDLFDAYFVNHYADHHVHELIMGQTRSGTYAVPRFPQLSRSFQVFRRYKGFYTSVSEMSEVSRLPSCGNQETGRNQETQLPFC